MRDSVEQTSQQEHEVKVPATSPQKNEAINDTRGDTHVDKLPDASLVAESAAEAEETQVVITRTTITTSSSDGSVIHE